MDNVYSFYQGVSGTVLVSKWDQLGSEHIDISPENFK